MSAEAQDVAPAKLSHPEVLSTLSGVLLGMFLGALDSTIVATALPTMAGELGGLEHLSWIVAGYLLTSTASTPIYGKLSDMYGRSIMLQISIATFIVTSVFCALAQDMNQLIAARALQGIGGGGLIAMGQAVIADIIAPRERGRYQVYFSGMYAFASIGGPVVGGLFVDHLSWRWVFWINLPLGLAAFALCRRSLARLPRPHLSRRIDYLGALLLTSSVATWLLILAWGGTSVAWTSPELFGLVALAIVLTAGLVVQELRAMEPLVPPRLFINPIVRMACFASFIGTLVQFGTSILLPSFLQLVQGVSAGRSGALIIPMMVGSVAGSFASGRIMRRTGRYRPAAIAGFCLSILALVALAFLAGGHSLPLIVFCMALFGIGMGPTFPAMMVAAQNGGEMRDLGVVTSIVAFSRSLGGSFGAAILWSAMIAALYSRLAVENATALGKKLLDGGPAAAAKLSVSARETLIPALAHSYQIVFLVCAVFALVGLVVLILLREKPLRTEAAMTARHREAAEV